MMQGLRGSGESMPQKTPKKQQDSKEEGEVCATEFRSEGEKTWKKRIFAEGFLTLSWQNVLVNYGDFW